MRSCVITYIAASLLGLLCTGVGRAQGTITASSANFGSFSGQTDNPGVLNCNLNAISLLGGNHQGIFNSQGYNLAIKLDANFGGIGTVLSFTNASNGASANVIEARSGTGAAWQTSYYLYDSASDTFIVFNQNAGNSIGYQWGYSNAVENLTESSWEPLISDAVTTQWSSNTPNPISTSPCANSGYKFDEGRGSFVATPIETPSGIVTHVINSFDLKSLEAQHWSFEDVEQALYLNKQVAISNNLRIYLGSELD